MPTNAKQQLSSTAYTQVTIAGDGFIQNVGTTNIYLEFALAPPSAVSEDAMILEPRRGFQILSGIPSGTPYARVIDQGRIGYVVATE